MIAVILLSVSLIFFLFSFYYYSKDDFFFIRKGITMNQLFNVLFIGLFWSIIGMKLDFHGISFFGGIVGLFLSYVWLTRRRKISTLRFLDYVSIAVLSALPLFFIAIFLNYYLCLLYLFILLIFINILLPRYNKGLLKDGIISFIFLIMVSFVQILQDFYLLYSKGVLLSKETFMFLGLLIFSLVMLIRLEIRKTT
jgi:hypothetical protein